MIPLSVPNLNGKEWEYIKECLDTNWVSSVGSYVDRFEGAISSYTGSPHAVATSNGTTALHISLLLAGVEPGDRVIVPNLTFVAPVNSIKYLGASPILVDADPHDWQMDLDLLEEFLKTECSIRNEILYHSQGDVPIRALMPVHVLGNICDMDRLMDLADKYRLKVVEDATESLGSTFDNKHAGTIGDFGSLSFNGNKIITTGGGGMILCPDAELAARARHLTTQAKSDDSEYVHDEIGYNYRLVNILAAMGVAQMEQLTGFLKRKKQVKEHYDEALNKIDGVVGQTTNPKVMPNHWLYTIKVRRKTELLAYLHDHEVEVRSLWVPMNQLKMFQNDIYISKHDQSKKLHRECICLPCSTGITKDQTDFVIQKITEFYK